MGTEQNSDLYNKIYPHVSGKLVFDIGSNVGKITKNLIEAGARVIAVEPLKKLTKNKNYDGVFAIKNVCVSDKVGKEIYNIATNRGGKFHAKNTCFDGWKRLWPTLKWKPMEIEATTLDSLIEEFGVPTYIKIDVEGFEHKVLAGLSKKIDFISFEFTGGFDNFLDCIKIIDKIGFTKMTPFLVKKIKGVSKTIRIHDKAGEFYKTSEIVEFYKSLIYSEHGNIEQGDILVESGEYSNEKNT